MQLFIITLLVLVLSIEISNASDSTKFNFEYTDGEKPWHEHVSTKINTTFEKALIKKPNLQNKLCGVDSIHNEISFYGSIKPFCLKGYGAKIVVPMGSPTWTFLIFKSPQDIGFIEQKHMTVHYPRHFYNKHSPSTKYFLVPFKDYEIPTFHPLETEIYLPIWRQAFQKINNIDDNYFSEHIRVISTTVNRRKHSVGKTLYFRVAYYLNIDWIKIKLEDNFEIGLPKVDLSEQMESPLFKDSLMILKQLLVSENPIISKYIQKISTKIASKDEVISAVTNASKLFAFNVNHHLRLTREGQFIGDLIGVVSDSANKCIQAKLLIETATVSKISSCVCWEY